MTIKKFLGHSAKVLAALIVLIIVAVLVARRVSDGPMGPLAGGPLRAGELVSVPDIDWSSLLGNGGEIELQLVDPPGSRITGAMVHEGQLYVPCDLGFIWHRVPRAGFRGILSFISSVKHWHEDALRDGRVVLRIAGKRYERNAVRVTDPEQLATLRSIIEKAANQVFTPPGLLDVPVDPDAIWFFRMDPRPAAIGATPR
jgi:hypothetical protein